MSENGDCKHHGTKGRQSNCWENEIINDQVMKMI